MSDRSYSRRFGKIMNQHDEVRAELDAWNKTIDRYHYLGQGLILLGAVAGFASIWLLNLGVWSIAVASVGWVSGMVCVFVFGNRAIQRHRDRVNQLTGRNTR